MKKNSRKYQIIYADPPWQYKVWSKKGLGRTAESHYPTQSLTYLKSLDVMSISDKDSVLLMWATFPCLKSAIELGEAWGFTYKTVAFTWIKTNKINDRLFIGMGHYTRANAEIVLLFTKGRTIPRCSCKVEQVLIAKISRHSQKPLEIKKRITDLLGDRTRIELFARYGPDLFTTIENDGWDYFGNETIRSSNLRFTNIDTCKENI
jgi:N6-adenosine-specific RNA methylase IME4